MHSLSLRLSVCPPLCAPPPSLPLRLLLSVCASHIFLPRSRYYSGNLIYRADILPVPVYLTRCLIAYKQLGDESLENFLDHSFLGDGNTSIREYVAQGGAEMPA